MTANNPRVQTDHTVFVADIGGTNSRLAVSRSGKVDPATISRYLNSDFSKFERVVKDFRKTAALGVQFDAAAVSVAGPVKSGFARLTNCDWAIESESVAKAAGCRSSSIINDLAATGHGLGSANPEDIIAIVSGDNDDWSDESAVVKQLIVNVGTGFNTSLVITTDSGTIVSDSECGRVTLPVRSNEDHDLKRYIEQAAGYAGVEHVLSGRGVELVHDWVCRRLPSGGPAGQYPIRETGFSGSRQSVETGRHMTRMLATVVGDMALHHLPNGGIYLVGGVVNALAPHLLEFGFEAALHDKGDYRDYMRQFSVAVVTDEYIALKGCASFCRPAKKSRSEHQGACRN